MSARSASAPPSFEKTVPVTESYLTDMFQVFILVCVARQDLAAGWQRGCLTHTAAGEALSQAPHLPSPTGERGGRFHSPCFAAEGRGSFTRTPSFLPPFRLPTHAVPTPELCWEKGVAGTEETGGRGQDGQRDRLFAQAELPDGQTDRLGTPSSVHLLKLPATSEPQRRPRLPEIPRDSHEQARRLKNCPASVKGSASGEKTTPGTPALSAASNTFWALLFPFPLYCAN